MGAKYLLTEILAFVGAEITLPDGAIQVGFKISEPVLDGNRHHQGLHLYYLIPKDEAEP